MRRIPTRSAGRALGRRQGSGLVHRERTRPPAPSWRGAVDHHPLSLQWARDDPQDRTAAREAAGSIRPLGIRPRSERRVRGERLARRPLRRRRPPAEGRRRDRLDQRQRRPLDQPEQPRPRDLPRPRRCRRALGTGDRLVGRHRLQLRPTGQSMARSSAPTRTSPAEPMRRNASRRSAASRMRNAPQPEARTIADSRSGVTAVNGATVNASRISR